MLLDAADRGEPVTLVTLAPMTNIALLLRTYPQVAAGIARLVFMGGSAAAGNVTAVGRVQRLARPRGGRDRPGRRATSWASPTTMYGLDVFYEPVVTRAEARGLLAGRTGSAGPAGGGADPVPVDPGRGGPGDDRRRRRGLRGGRPGRPHHPADAGAGRAGRQPGPAAAPSPTAAPTSSTWTTTRTVGGGRTGPVDVAVAVDGGAIARLWLDTVGAG